MPGRNDRAPRKPTRLRGWDYSSPAGYYVTICLDMREPRFGEVVNGVMHLNRAGEMVSATWIANAGRYPGAALDAFIVMPDHIHGIVFIGADPAVPKGDTNLIRLVQSFKSISAIEYGHGVRAGLYPPYDRDFWQRTFHDHIIRNDRDLDRIRAYIEANPARWSDKRGWNGETMS